MKDFDKLDKKMDKATEIIASIGMVSSISAFSTLISSLTTTEQLSIITGGTILLSPCIYFGMNALKKKSQNRNFDKNKQKLAQKP